MHRFRTNSRKLSFALAGLLLFVSIFAGSAYAKEEQAVPEHMQERVERVFARVAAVAVLEHPHVVDYTVEAVIEKIPNAWINKDNEVYVTSGLLELLPTDDQLAGVIGHEIAHGTEGHIPHRISQSLWSAFAVIALGTVASSQGSSDWGGLLHMRDLFMYAFGREQETEADLVGLRYARAAGYASHGLVEALQLMDQDRRRLPQDSIWQQLYRTHPPIFQRVADLRLILATESLNKAPLRGTLSPITTGARSPEEAALGFARGLLSGDENAMRPYVLPGRAAPLLALASVLSQHVDPLWAQAELEVVARPESAVGSDAEAASDRTDEPSAEPSLGLRIGGSSGFSTILIVRLWRPASVAEVAAGVGVEPDGAEMSSPALELTLQQSARGWVITAWDVANES